MSAHRFNVRQFVVLSLLAFGLFAIGTACDNPNGESCTSSSSHSSCPE